MKTLILPGYSPGNKQWAEETKNNMKLNHEILVHKWQHWTKGSFSLKRELANIIEEIGDDRVNVLAKSVGVRVAFELMQQMPGRINKVILAGTAGAAKDENKKMLKDAIRTIGVNNIICIQNENDKYLKYEDAKVFYKDVDKELKVVSKSRSDHNYPYPEDFEAFLRG